MKTTKIPATLPYELEVSMNQMYQDVEYAERERYLIENDQRASSIVLEIMSRNDKWGMDHCFAYEYTSQWFRNADGSVEVYAARLQRS